MFTMQGAGACCHCDNNEVLWVTSIQMIRGEKQQAAGRQHKEASKGTNVIYLLHRWQRYDGHFSFLFALRTLNEFGGGICYTVTIQINSILPPVIC